MIMWYVYTYYKHVNKCEISKPTVEDLRSLFYLALVQAVATAGAKRFFFLTTALILILKQPYYK
jgi:hypothetical protein